MSKKRRPQPASARRRQAPAGPSRPAGRSRQPGGSRPAWLLPAAAVAVALVAVALAVVAAVAYSRSGGTSTHAGAASPAATAAGPGPTGGRGQVVNGISCERQEQALFHVHAHLAIFAGGAARTVPAGIGIPGAQIDSSAQGPSVASGSCFYWLHSHATDGVIHVESPVQRTFTLGDWFDVWGQPLSATQVGADTGQVIAYVNGQRYQGDPRSIPLQAHAVIQLDVGQDVAPRPYTFPQGY